MGREREDYRVGREREDYRVGREREKFYRVGRERYWGETVLERKERYW